MVLAGPQRRPGSRRHGPAPARPAAPGLPSLSRAARGRLLGPHDSGGSPPPGRPYLSRRGAGLKGWGGAAAAVRLHLPPGHHGHWPRASPRLALPGRGGKERKGRGRRAAGPGRGTLPSGPGIAPASPRPPFSAVSLCPAALLPGFPSRAVPCQASPSDKMVGWVRLFAHSAAVPARVPLQNLLGDPPGQGEACGGHKSRRSWDRRFLSVLVEVVCRGTRVAPSSEGTTSDPHTSDMILPAFTLHQL